MRDRMLAGLGCALAVIAVAGCAHQAGSQGSTVQACAAAGLTAIRQHVTIRSMPSACRRLSAADLEQSIADALNEAAGDVPKALLRHRAYLASFRLTYLITAARHAASAAARAARRAAESPGARSPAAVAASADRRAGLGVGAGLAGLVAWLMTAASGGYLLAGWVGHGGMRRTRSRSSGLPPAVILSHFGMAVAGLAVWTGYLLTAAPALAWTAVGILLPVAGLGIATLVLSVPEPAPANSPPGPTDSPSAAAPVLVISAHGLLATATLLLVMLAAVATS